MRKGEIIKTTPFEMVLIIRAFMKISYKKLWVMLIEREIPKSTLRKDIELSPGTMSKLNKNEDVALSVLLRICDYLNCDIGDICEAVRTGKK